MIYHQLRQITGKFRARCGTLIHMRIPNLLLLLSHAPLHRPIGNNKIPIMIFASIPPIFHNSHYNTQAIVPRVHPPSAEYLYSPHSATKINRAATTANHDVPAVVRAGGYSHYPAYSPLPPANPHALPRPHNRSSSVATYASTPTLQQSSPLPTNNSNIPQLPEHAEFSPPFAHFSPGSLSNSSIETFANPNNPTGPPLSKHDANIEGLKQRIMAPCRSWKVKVARILKRVKSSLAIL
ncbi:uncharacterized protein EKO05_0006261 [Ascochyta rabiei]|uniref:uncharacterized protein n=1 Tax=Didymella rabiei TaxID=5454 RepID=UPI0021FAFB38|nr:uncharacterized protein EKO05_0006261 [Ascochyta rabiei]UPX15824.1 hypothetical protein EKO05_0006261 [Ascochyta rabiei]